MCRAVRCKTCDKTTWAGCGKHVADVKAGVPASQWCPGGHDNHPAATATRPSRAGGLLSKLFGSRDQTN